MSKDPWLEKQPDSVKIYFNPMRTFHIVRGVGEGGVSLLIRKNNSTWLYRLFRFGETSRFVHDSNGKPIVYNHVEQLIDVLKRKQKIHAMYEYVNGELVEWSPEKYNKAWFVGMYSSDTTTENALIQDPYHFWVKGYKAHFVLERVTEKRKHYAYYRPIN